MPDPGPWLRKQIAKERAMGIEIGKYVDSKWITADDIGDGSFPVTIREVTEELIHSPRTNKEELVPVIWFTKGRKGLIPCKTNLRDMVARLGDDTDAWANVECELYTESTSMGRGSRIRVTQPPQAEAAPDAAFTDDALSTDDLPF